MVTFGFLSYNFNLGAEKMAQQLRMHTRYSCRGPQFASQHQKKSMSLPSSDFQGHQTPKEFTYIIQAGKTLKHRRQINPLKVKSNLVSRILEFKQDHYMITVCTFQTELRK